MVEMRIKWASACPLCGHSDALIQSSSTEYGCFHDSDAVKCCNCGHTGLMNADGEDSDIYWDDVEALSKDVILSLGEVP